ncbi:MAG: hypothetical protein NC548_10795 [Lachnospiraceae bacterium]|nr:hypothetical protein [Lachnospiraceae bacterium]MCM1236813.1 hypothetical protein [Ruminococcus flavefaciens]
MRRLKRVLAVYGAILTLLGSYILSMTISSREFPLIAIPTIIMCVGISLLTVLLYLCTRIDSHVIPDETFLGEIIDTKVMNIFVGEDKYSEIIWSMQRVYVKLYIEETVIVRLNKEMAGVPVIGQEVEVYLFKNKWYFVNMPETANNKEVI